MARIDFTLIRREHCQSGRCTGHTSLRITDHDRKLCPIVGYRCGVERITRSGGSWDIHPIAFPLIGEWCIARGHHPKGGGIGLCDGYRSWVGGDEGDLIAQQQHKNDRQGLDAWGYRRGEGHVTTHPQIAPTIAAEHAIVIGPAGGKPRYSHAMVGQEGAIEGTGGPIGGRQTVLHLRIGRFIGGPGEGGAGRGKILDSFPARSISYGCYRHSLGENEKR